MELELGYPNYFLLLCFAIGLIYSLGLYLKSKKKSNLSKTAIHSLFIVRFLIVSTLCFLLLEPTYKTVKEKKEKPIVIFAQDNSKSILLSKDSSFFLNGYSDSIVRFSKKIAAKYDVDFLKFGSVVEEDFDYSFNDKTTDIDELFCQIGNKYYGRNLSTVIIASDGLFNSGYHPLYKEYGLDDITIHTISIGDSTTSKDLSIQQVRNNEEVVLGNIFPVEISLLSQNFQNEEFDCFVYLDGEKVYEHTIKPQIEIESIKLPITLEASKLGLSKYKVEIQRKNGEITYQNNSSFFYVNVVDQTQKVLVLARSPHPDVSALKSALSNKIGRSISIELLKDFNGDISNYDLIITHRLTTQISKKVIQLFETAEAANLPLFNISGSLMSPNYSNLKLGVEMNELKGSYSVGLLFNSNFNDFIVPLKMSNKIEKFPPLDVPFSSDYKTVSQGSTVLFQNISGVQTTYPLLKFNEMENQKTAILLGEGIWRWRLEEMMQNGNANFFDSFISKIIQYLLNTEKKEKFSIDVKQEFIENESVKISAKLYNENYEFVPFEEVKVEIFNDSTKVVEQLLISNNSRYFTTINQLLPGNYRVNVSTNFGDKFYSKEANFIVKKMQMEFMKTKADFHFLNLLSNKYNGETFRVSSLNALADKLLKDEQVGDVIHYDLEYEDIIKRSLLFVLICIFLFTEWFVRKVMGSY